MARSEAVRYAFNRGLISPIAIARVDLKRSALSAEIQTNFPPRRLGSMMLRPGLQYLCSSKDNATARGIPFIAAIDATYILEFTTGAMRVLIDDTPLTRAAVSSTVANGTFDTNLASWTDNDEAGGASVWVTGGYMGLTGNGTAAAIRDQQVTVAVGDRNVEHALRIVVHRGPVLLRVGSAVGDDSYINEATLYTGTHSLAFTPTGDFHIRFLSRLKRQVLVNSCAVEGSGVVSVTSPYVAADLDYIRADPDSQSVDVLFVGCRSYTQRRIERRAAGRSWSIALYQPDNGPFMSPNVGTMTLTPSALSGNGTLTASRAFFRTTHAPSTNNGGALFRVSSTGQTVTASITAQNTFTNAIRVTGVGNDRAVAVTLTGLTASGSTMTLQRSLDSATGPWTDVSGKTWTADTAETYNDTLDNQIVWYRIGVKTGDYGAGTNVATLTYPSGSITGVARVTGYTSTTVVDIEIITDFGAITATDDWSEGRWSDLRGWPTAGTLYDGRLHWAGRDRFQGSESDQFDGFDPDAEGDAGPWDRSIGSGPLATINWLLPLERLIMGAQHAEYSLRSTTFDEPLTPTNLNCKPCSTEGSYSVQAVKYGDRGQFVQRGGTRAFELEFDPSKLNYGSKDMTVLNPEVLQPRAVRLAVQMQPDPRFHYVLSDGTVALFIRDPAEDVMCWCKIDSIAYNYETGAVRSTGTIEDVVVLPGAVGATEDRVYYLVKRTVNSATVRFWEKWALESECAGGTVDKRADSHVAFTYTSASSVVSGLSHLIGESVVVWADGKCLRDADGEIAFFTVSVSGTINLTDLGVSYGATTGVVGLGYRARFKTAKLGQTLSKQKNVDRIAPVLKDTHAQGLWMGPDFDHLDNLPLMYQGAPVDSNSVYSEYDEESQSFPGNWNTDARVCMEARAPRSCNVLALTIEGQVT